MKKTITIILIAAAYPLCSDDSHRYVRSIGSHIFFNISIKCLRHLDTKRLYYNRYIGLY